MYASGACGLRETQLFQRDCSKGVVFPEYSIVLPSSETSMLLFESQSNFF